MILLILLPIYFFGLLVPLKIFEDYGPGTYNWKKAHRQIRKIIVQSQGELDEILAEKFKRDVECGAILLS